MKSASTDAICACFHVHYRRSIMSLNVYACNVILALFLYWHVLHEVSDVTNLHDNFPLGVPLAFLTCTNPTLSALQDRRIRGVLSHRRRHVPAHWKCWGRSPTESRQSGRCLFESWDCRTNTFTTPRTTCNITTVRDACTRCCATLESTPTSRSPAEFCAAPCALPKSTNCR